MNDVPSWIVLVAAIVSVLVTVVSRKVLKGDKVLGHPVIAFCGGALTFIGFLEFAKDWSAPLLLPYVATGAAMIIALLFLPFKYSRRYEGKNGANRHLLDIGADNGRRSDVDERRACGPIERKGLRRDGEGRRQA